MQGRHSSKRVLCALVVPSSFIVCAAKRGQSPPLWGAEPTSLGGGAHLFGGRTWEASWLSVIEYIKILKYNFQPVNLFLRMVVSAVPFLIVQTVFYGIQPDFGGFINGRLIDAGQKYFYRLIFQRCGMTEYNVYAQPV